jgi:hypothetical protein
MVCDGKNGTNVAFQPVYWIRIRIVEDLGPGSKIYMFYGPVLSPEPHIICRKDPGPGAGLYPSGTDPEIRIYARTMDRNPSPCTMHICYGFETLVSPGLWIRIHIRMFLGLPDPDPSLFVRIRIWIWIRILPSTSKKIKNNLDFYYFVTSF